MHTYYATFDNQGNITGHYIEGINLIPNNAIKMTEEQWKQSCDGNLIRDIKNKKWIPKPKPTTLETLNNEKFIKNNEINNTRDIKIGEGVEYSGYVFDSDTKAFDNLNETLTTVNLGIPLPEDYTWRTKDNKNVPVDKNFLIGLAGTLMNHKFNCYKKSWELKEKVDKAKSPDEVRKIQW